VFWQSVWLVLGFNVWAYYVLNGLLQLAGAWLFYELLKDDLHWGGFTSTIGAALMLIFPSDTAHIYLAALPTRLALLFTLLCARAWLNKRGTQWFSLACIPLALWLNETPFFLFCCIPFLTFKRAAPRPWLTRAVLAFYGVLAGCLLLRLGMVPLARALGAVPLYTQFQISGDWLLLQARSFPLAVFGLGWLYALSALVHLPLVVAGGLLIFVLIGSLGFVLWIAQTPPTPALSSPTPWQLILFGGGLTCFGALPVFVSSYSFEQTVGSFEGRLLSGSAMGYALVLVGLIELPTQWARLRWAPLWKTLLTTLFLTLSLFANLGEQRAYAQMWQKQLTFAHSLNSFLENPRPNTTFLLINVPATALDLRFYTPYTNLVNLFYNNASLHVLPWQEKIPASEQLVVLGHDELFAATQIVNIRASVKEFSYNNLIAFTMAPQGHLAPLTTLGAAYLVNRAQAPTMFELPATWAEAQPPINLPSPQDFNLPEAPPTSHGRQFLLDQIEWSRRFPAP
jgi:hypothetical protein